MASITAPRTSPSTTRPSPTVWRRSRYDIKSATVNAANDVVIEFGIKQRIAPSTTDSLVTFVAPAAGVANPLAGFTGGPSFLLAFAVPQDGIATPVDYNNIGSGSGNAQPRSACRSPAC